jgi:hypothetical protein
VRRVVRPRGVGPKITATAGGKGSAHESYKYLRYGSLLQLALWLAMALIAQIALGVIIGGVALALLVTSFFVWNSRQRDERLAFGLFIGGLVIVMVLVVVVASY